MYFKTFIRLILIYIWLLSIKKKKVPEVVIFHTFSVPILLITVMFLILYYLIQYPFHLTAVHTESYFLLIDGFLVDVDDVVFLTLIVVVVFLSKCLYHNIYK